MNIVLCINMKAKLNTLCRYGECDLLIATSYDRVAHPVQETGAYWCAHCSQRFRPCQINCKIVNTCDLKVCWFTWDWKINTKRPLQDVAYIVTYVQDCTQVLFNKYFIFDRVLSFSYYFICDRITCVLVNFYR